MPQVAAKALHHDRVHQWVRDEEAAIQKACPWLRENKHQTMQDAAAKFTVGYYKLRSQYLSLHAPPRDAQKKKRLLSPVQEDVLVAWMRLWSAEDTPIT